MFIESGDYKINSVGKKGPVFYNPPANSLHVEGELEEGTKFHISKVEDLEGEGVAYVINAFKEGTYARIRWGFPVPPTDAHTNVEPPTPFPFVNADSKEPVLWKIIPTDVDPDRYMIIVYAGDFKDKTWFATHIGTMPTPYVMVSDVDEQHDPNKQFTFTRV